MFWLVLLVIFFFAFAYFKLRGENLSYLDQPPLQAPANPPSPELFGVLEVVKQFGDLGKPTNKKNIIAAREFMDSFNNARDFECEFRPVQAGNVRGEWVLAPGADSRRRLLYIHGGAWIAGSPKSHRALTDRLARDTGCAIFSVDYRLMPEHPRRAGIEDCQDAYRWLLKNAPEGPLEADFIAVAGDSAGGNLTLSLITWIRDQGLRQVDAAVGFSPATDGTMTGPSLRRNLYTDAMLGPGFGFLTIMPKPLLWWSVWIGTRFMPSDPLVSPVHAELSNLPPTLIQVSEQEMLLDDARRYVRKASVAGSPVQLQTWPHMVHVWQMFNPELPEANEALDKVAEFLREAGNQSGAASA